MLKPEHPSIVEFFVAVRLVNTDFWFTSKPSQLWETLNLNSALIILALRWVGSLKTKMDTKIIANTII